MSDAPSLTGRDWLLASGCRIISSGGAMDRDYSIHFDDPRGVRRSVMVTGSWEGMEVRLVERVRAWLYPRLGLMDERDVWLHRLRREAEASDREIVRLEERCGKLLNESAQLAADAQAAEAVQVWRFRDAPAALQRLSSHGGDEDWLALVPASMTDDYYPWMDDGTSFGCFSVDEHDLPSGDVVHIGAHS